MSREPTRAADMGGAAGVAVGAHTHTHAHIDWAAVLAGAFVASAIFWVLNTFGTGVGLALTSPYPGARPPGKPFLIGAGLWLVWVTVSSHMAGAYIAGRMRRRAFDASEHESNVRDGVHGLVVWALGVLIGGVILALASAGTTAGVDSGTAGAAAQRATQAAMDAARKAGVVSTFVTAAALAIAAAGAAWAATMGGNHRDQNTDTSWWWWRRG